MAKLRYIALILSIALTGLLIAPASAQKSRSRATTQELAYRPAAIQLTAFPKVVTNCGGGEARGSLVQLEVHSDLPSAQSTRYRWSANGGHIEGDGPNTRWDLSDLKAGYYKASVEVGDTKDCVAFSEVTVAVRC